MIFGHNSDEYKALINTHSRAHRHSPGIGDSSSPCCVWVIHHWNFLLQSIKWEARPGEWCHSFEPTVKSGHHPLHEMQDTRTVHARNLQLGSECTDLLSSVLFYGTAYETWLWRLKSVTFIRQKECCTTHLVWEWLNRRQSCWRRRAHLACLCGKVIAKLARCLIYIL